MPGAFMRGRQTAAMLRMMGLESLIATDVDDYVTKAIELASNRSMNESIRELIAARKTMVFGRSEANAGFADALCSTVLTHVA